MPTIYLPTPSAKCHNILKQNSSPPKAVSSFKTEFCCVKLSLLLCEEMGKQGYEERNTEVAELWPELRGLKREARLARKDLRLQRQATEARRKRFKPSTKLLREMNRVPWTVLTVEELEGKSRSR